MPLKIHWTPESKITYNNTLESISEKWPAKELKKFVQKTENVLSNISQNPELFPRSKRKNTRKCVVTRHTSLFYRIKQDEIELVSFWDNRQDPKKLKL